MKISAIPSFTSSYRAVINFKEPECSEKYIDHRNTTYFFRDDMNWDYLFNYILKKYDNVDKVNTYFYGCSDGSEPYSFIMKMMTLLGEDGSEKYMPVIAKDYDRYIINRANSKQVTLMNYEPAVINKHTNNNITKYLEYLGEQRGNGYSKEFVYRVKPELFGNVKFNTADIMSDTQNINPDNSIVFCRNFWPYLRSSEKINELANKLYAQLGENSFVILGGYDMNDNRIYKAMINAGFKLVEPYLRIFEKNDILPGMYYTTFKKHPAIVTIAKTIENIN